VGASAVVAGSSSMKLSRKHELITYAADSPLMDRVKQDEIHGLSRDQEVRSPIKNGERQFVGKEQQIDA